MRPKKTVGERLRPDEAAEARPNIRLRIVGVVGVTLFALMLMRLWYLQVLDANAATQQVVTNEVRTVPLPAPRGLILDRSDGVVVGETSRVFDAIAPRDDAGGAVLLGEVGHRPNRVALHVESHREWEEIECPLIPV